MRESFQASKRLRAPHVQTLWAYFVQGVDPVSYTRERLETEDGDFLDLDWVHGSEDGPVIVALHGLEGSSTSSYMRRLMARIQGRGGTAVVLHARGCSGENNRTVYSYNAAWTEDLAFLVRVLMERMPGREIGLVGYSLGGSQIGNYLSRQETPDAVKAAFLVSPPLDLVPCAEVMNSGFNKMYTGRFLATLRLKLVGKAMAFPEFRRTALRAMLVGSVWGFDEKWTAPINGYSGAEAYYAGASCAPYLHQITVPTRVLAAKDDPLVPWESIVADRIAEAPHVELQGTERGGHVGFCHHSNPHWLEDQILEGLAELGLGTHA